MKHPWTAMLVILLCAAMAVPAGAAPDDEPKKEEADKGVAKETAKETPAEEKPAPAEEKPAPAEEKPTPVQEKTTPVDEKTTTPEKPKEKSEADKLKERLLTAAAGGTLTDELVDLFGTYAMTRARETLANDVPADFWPWVEANATIRDGLLVALHPDYSPGVVKCLQKLREKFAEKVDGHPHLALAFAVVFGRAGEDEPWGPYRSYLRRDREPPTMEQSFRYYLKFEKSMKLSLTGTPWPLLAHVVDNETPLKERLWVLKNFGRSAGKGVYYKVPYDWDKLKGNADIGNRPRTLENIRKYGGVCVDRAYFASRVYKSLGIPSIAVDGEGQRGGHAWVAWIGRMGKAYEFTDSGRFDNDKYYTGSTWDPLARKRVLDRDVELLAVAVATSYDEYLKTRIGCHVYGMFEPEARKNGTGLLKDSVEHNPFVAQAWRLLADACVEGVITAKEGEKIFDSIFKALATYPDLTYEVLAKVLAPRLELEGEPDKEDVDRNLLVLSRAFHLYEKGKRPDLAVKLCVLQGEYLEALKRQKAALKLYVTASETYARQHYGFREVFDRVLRMLADDKALRRRLAFCEMMVKKVPRQRGSLDKKLNQLNPSYVYVVRAYARALYTAGQDRQAQRWEEKIQPRDD